MVQVQTEKVAEKSSPGKVEVLDLSKSNVSQQQKDILKLQEENL